MTVFDESHFYDELKQILLTTMTKTSLHLSGTSIETE